MAVPVVLVEVGYGEFSDYIERLQYYIGELVKHRHRLPLAMLLVQGDLHLHQMPLHVPMYKMWSPMFIWRR
jgi:hypothetical protein